MLVELRIASLGVIGDATVEFGPGFTAVTGETGAGGLHPAAELAEGEVGSEERGGLQPGGEVT